MRILLLIPLTTLALAQTPAVQPQDKGRIEGILVNQVNGQPLRKGTVSLRVTVTGPQPANASTPNSYSVTSDAEGKFIFEQVDPGRYTLMADRPGYIHAIYRSSGGASLNVGPGQIVKNIRFVITPQGVIAGHVVDEDGDPITEVRVQAMRWSTTNGVRRLEYRQQIPVDDQGNFRIGNLPAGRYILSADLNRMPALNSEKIHKEYVTTYYPSALDVAESTEIPLTAGGEVINIEIRLHKVIVFHVRGKIVDSTGALVRNMALAIFPKNAGASMGFFGRNLTITRDGVFDFPTVRPGSYVIQPANNVFFGTNDQNESGTNKKLFGRYAVTVSNEDLKDIVVPLSVGATVTGTIVTEGGAPQPPPTDPTSAKTAAKPPPQPTVRLAPADSTELSPYTARSNADGTFELHDLAPERYRVNVNGTADGTYVKSIRFGNEDVTNGILDLTSGTGGVIDVKLAPNAADISGNVHNDKSEAVSDVQVTLGPASAEVATQTLFFRQARTNQDGKFSFKNLPPGEYRIWAWEEVDNGLVSDPQFRAHFDSGSVLVRLSEGSHENSDVKLLGRDAIEVEAAKVR
jgi:protocatechuate 3,4-dioxygenase beta subunit